MIPSTPEVPGRRTKSSRPISIEFPESRGRIRLQHHFYGQSGQWPEARIRIIGCSEALGAMFQQSTASCSSKKRV